MDQENKPNQAPDIDNINQQPDEHDGQPDIIPVELAEAGVDGVVENQDDVTVVGQSSAESVVDTAMQPEPNLEADTVADGAVPVIPHPDFASDEGAAESRVEPVVEPEIEPATAPEATQQPTADSAADCSQKSKSRLIILAVVAVLVLVGAGLIFWQMTKSDATEAVPDNNTANVEQPKLDVSVAVVDGQAAYQRSGDDWLDLTASTQLAEGDVVRTDADSRAVLTLDAVHQSSS